MIDYLLRSALCLTALLAVYHLFLEREKMHRFNRFFLLFSLGFGLLAPVISIELPSGSLPEIPFHRMGMPITHLQTAVYNIGNSKDTPQSPETSYFPDLIIFLYGFGAVLLLFRFAKNLVRITSYVSKNPKLSFGDASLVLLSKETLPYSFLNFIFINKEDYRNQRIEAQLLTHELTHVRQLHSVDILFIEVLRILFWFNPVFNLYKKAIQLNHEFIADEAVLSSYDDVYAYQHLLLDKAISERSVQLVSNLNHSVTQKRLKMMIKQTSGFKKRAIQLMVMPAIAALLFLVSTKAISQAPQLKSTTSSTIVRKEYIDRETYYKGSTIWTLGTNGKFTKKKYADMSAAEKAALPDVPVPVPPKIPGNDMLAEWKSKPLIYGIRINGKRIPNEDLSKYKAADFGFYHKSEFPAALKAKNKIDYGIDLFSKANLTIIWNHGAGLLNGLLSGRTKCLTVV